MNEIETIRDRIEALIHARTEELAAERDEALADAAAITEHCAVLQGRFDDLRARHKRILGALRAIAPRWLHEFSLDGFLADDETTPTNDETTP